MSECATDLVGNPRKQGFLAMQRVLFDLRTTGWVADLLPRLTTEVMSGLLLNQRKSKNGRRNIPWPNLLERMCQSCTILLQLILSIDFFLHFIKLI